MNFSFVANGRLYGAFCITGKVLSEGIDFRTGFVPFPEEGSSFCNNPSCLCMFDGFGVEVFCDDPTCLCMSEHRERS